MQQAPVLKIASEEEAHVMQSLQEAGLCGGQQEILMEIRGIHIFAISGKKKISFAEAGFEVCGPQGNPHQADPKRISPVYFTCPLPEPYKQCNARAYISSIGDEYKIEICQLCDANEASEVAASLTSVA